VTAW
jgi:hypothetical protein